MNRLLQYFLYLLVGIAFGILLTKAEITSWYRIQEMFRFQSFHMYGIIGSAVVLGAVLVQTLKHFKVKSINNEAVKLIPKEKSVHRYIWGGMIFGLGWALTGACPGPMYAMIGQGYLAVILVMGSALLGTFVYGILRPRLPH
jgi:hypothetical protein